MKIKTKEYIIIILLIITFFAAVSSSIVGYFNFLSYERLNDDVVIYKQQSDAINFYQQVVIIDLKFENMLQDSNDAKLFKRVDQNLEGINWNTGRVVVNKVEIDNVSHESCKVITDELWTELERLRKKVD